MKIAGVEIKETDRIYLTSEQIEEMDKCLDYLNGYISAISIIGNSCFDPNIEVDIAEAGMAMMGLSKEAAQKWCSMRDTITEEVFEQIRKQKEVQS